MAEVMRVNGRLFVHTHGLRELSKALSGAPRELQRDVAAAMKHRAEPTAERARQLAWAFAASGEFASSIKIEGGRAGVFLAAKDSGAGPIEFAHPGALATTGPNRGEPIGVPYGGGPPARALFPAIEQTIGDLAAGLTEQIETTLAVLDFDFRTRD